MRKKVAVLLLVAILLTMSMAIFCACDDEEPEQREVELELVNPITGDAIKDGDTIDLPEEKTPIEVRIKDRETGRYLKDSDLPENTIKDSCEILFRVLDKENKKIDGWDSYGYWPTKKYLEEWPRSQSNYYEIYISFDCRPENPRNPKTFQRKYKMESDYIRFYINKSWREQ
ncbi:MAG: hypothetical protein K2N32_04565 [Clostridia bacterium]|nr:hypothetical protein [Clostridia bacterium]